ncbi:MAG: histidine kinase [uncultured bacterium]|nr:MAG: histidine kinase [uncultured bacterium]
MTETGLKTRIVFTFAIMLALAMFLQSIVVMFLGVRESIREDVIWAKRFVQSVAASAPLIVERVAEKPNPVIAYDKIPQAYRDAFSCLVVEVAGEVVSETPPCRFREELMSRSQQAKTMKTVVTGFAGEEWKIYSFGSEVALIAVPLVDSAGQVHGSISAERSLLPIYSRYQEDMGIALCYLLVNVIVFSSLGFFRFVRLFFRPLDKLVSMAENYYPDEQSLFPFSDDESAFRKLSISLNALLDRIKRDNRSLRNTVSELEDANRELKEKKDLVVRSEKLASTGRLSAGLAHEIGNPLSIIQGYVELLGREDLTGDEKRQFSGKAQQELDRIKKLIRQLLDFSRPIRNSEEKIAVNSLISEVISIVSLEKAFVDCKLSTELSAEVDELVVDKDALRQVLINVLFNAVDATAERGDGREIGIATFNEESSELGAVLVISIKDNGIGIAGENLKYIFDPFFTTKEVGRGTGLGLFVCHTIMERMGGSISVYNRDPQGIEVRIELPLRSTASSHCR